MNKNCVLCGEEITGYGHNGEPLVKGQVCDKCNSKVIIARLKEQSKEPNLQELLENTEDIFDDFCRNAQELIDKMNERNQK